MLPVVASSGKPANAGIAVATPILPGGAMQQCLCAAVVLDVRPLNVTLTCKVCAVGSSVTCALPVPGEMTAGFSFAPESTAVHVAAAGPGFQTPGTAAPPAPPEAPRRDK